MLKNLNENDWVAIYTKPNLFLKVARIDHKIILMGDEAETYGKSYLELLFIRIKDRMNKSIDADGAVKNDYLIIDAETGKELEGKKQHFLVERIPDCKNIVFEQTGKTWYDEIEKQKLIYTLSDIEWKSIDLKDLQSIKKQLDIGFFERNYAN